MADGSIVINTEIDDKQAQAELAKLTKKIDNLNDKIKEQEAQKMPLIEQAKQLGAELDIAKQKLESMQSGSTFETASGIKQQQEAVNSLQKEWDAVNKKIESIDSGINKSQISIDVAKEKAGGYEQQLAATADAAYGISPAMEQATTRLDSFSRRVGGLLKRVFVFSLITMALRGMRTWLSNVIKTDKEATKAIGQLKAALLTLAQPLVQVIIPAFISLVNVITRIITTISSLTARLFGTTREAAAGAAESLNEETEALGGTGKAAKKASKSLASFDEINTASGGDNGGGGGASFAPDFSTPILSSIESVVELFTGAALLGLGAILTFSGVNIPLGIGLMAIGAIAIYDAISSNWGEISSILRGQVGAIVALLSTALLAIGAILAFSGTNIPLGIGLMAAGAIGMATVIAANWDALTKLVKDNLLTIGIIASTSVLALGIILAASGINIPLGIALIAMGAVMFAGTLFANWEKLPDNVKRTITIVTSIVSVALLAIGAILAFSGANIPLGIALIAAGAVGLATVIHLNWDIIKEKIAGAWSRIKEFWSKNISKYLTKKYWADLGTNMMNGILEKVIGGVNSILSAIGNLVNSAGNLLNKLPGVNIQPVNWGNIKVPKLAQGAVIPPNREFMAVLGDQKSGTNIETPLATMVQAFKQALAESGYNGNNEAVLVLDRETLGKVVYRLNKSESNRVGVSLTGV